MNIRIVFFLLFFQISLVAFSQTDSIKGIIVSDEGKPIELANVVLSDKEGMIIKGTITDSLGRFNLVLDSDVQKVDKILTVSYLGYKKYMQPVEKEDVGTIILLPDNNELQETIVTARQTPYTMKGTTLSADVQKSILKDAGNAVDVIKQLPLINVKDDIISVFGKGNALVYIDNNELRNIEELQKLSSKNIKKIDIITMPGSQYSASTGAVVKIYTIDAAEGLSGLIQTMVQRGNDWSESLLSSVSYAENKFTFLADYSIQDLRKKQEQETDVTINGLSQNLIHSNNQLNFKRGTHNFSIASEYKISEQHLFGARYNHSFLANGHYSVSGVISAYFNSRKDTEYSQLSDYYPKGNNGNINVFYKGKLFGWDVDVNADYTFGYAESLASYDNTEHINNTQSTVNSNSKNKYRLGATKLELTRQIGNSMLSFGTDYVKIQNESFYCNDDFGLQDDLPQTSTLNAQDSYALFLNYKHNFRSLHIEAGLRYEFINQRYYTNSIKEESQSKTYSNFFPTLSLSHPFFNDKVNMSLSYRRVINRPSYYQLRGDIQYNSPYSYEAGNPLLQDTYIDDISYTVSYSNLNFIASYKSYHDKILFVIEQYEDKPITISHFINMDGFKKISIAEIWDPTFFKIWNPQIEVGFEKQFLKVSDENITSSYNRPIFYISLYNVLKFPRNISYVIQAKYWTSYNSGISYEKRAMFVDTFIQKSFLNNSMVIKIGAENIFNTYKDKWAMIYKNINYKKCTNDDNRFVYISFIFNLHKAKKYSGKGTRNSEQNRLNTL